MKSTILFGGEQTTGKVGPARSWRAPRRQRRGGVEGYDRAGREAFHQAFPGADGAASSAQDQVGVGLGDGVPVQGGTMTSQAVPTATGRALLVSSRSGTTW
jgi:hypothetical protein